MKKFILSILLILVITLNGCKFNTDSTVYTAEGIYFNTYVSIALYGCGSQEIADEALRQCAFYEKIFSRTMENGILYNLNNNGKLNVINEEDRVLSDILKKSLDYCEMTAGNMDITVEPLTSLWDFSSGKKYIPTDEELSNAVAKVGYKNVVVNEESILLNDVRLDLGAVAKGYVADCLKTFLKEKGVDSALINLGGNILCIGEKPNGSNFFIGIKKPFTEDVQLVIGATDCSIVTSGTYERYFDENGKSYHHILDPKTGMPCDNGVVSVTIISEDSFTGDCLSTGCFVMGLEAGMELVDSMDGVYAVYIDSENNVHFSEGAEEFVREKRSK